MKGDVLQASMACVSSGPVTMRLGPTEAIVPVVERAVAESIAVVETVDEGVNRRQQEGRRREKLKYACKMVPERGFYGPATPAIDAALSGAHVEQARL